MPQKMRDTRKDTNPVEVGVTKYLNDYIKFTREPRQKHYEEAALREIFKGVLWMSEIDRKLMNKAAEMRSKQNQKIQKAKSVEYETKKWSEDSRAIAIKQPTLWNRMFIIAGFFALIIVIVLIILTLTLWAPK